MPVIGWSCAIEMGCPASMAGEDASFAPAVAQGKQAGVPALGVAARQRRGCVAATPDVHACPPTAGAARWRGGTSFGTHQGITRDAGRIRQKEPDMNKKQWLLAIVLFDFSLLNAYVLYQYGYSGFLELATGNAA